MFDIIDGEDLPNRPNNRRNWQINMIKFKETKWGKFGSKEHKGSLKDVDSMAQFLIISRFYSFLNKTMKIGELFLLEKGILRQLD